MKKLNVLYFLFRVSEKFPFISLVVVVVFFLVYLIFCVGILLFLGRTLVQYLKEFYGK